MVISMSLWGTDEIYTNGAIENAKCAKRFYPGWEMWVYHDDTVPAGVLNSLYELGAVLKPQPEEPGYIRLFWRFFPAAIKRVERFISRDADSRLGIREARAVEEWINSSNKFHIMRDHPNHNHPIMGGMWGCVSGAIPNMSDLIYSGMKTARQSKRITIQGCGFDEDQTWLENVVWPIAKESCTQHDECPERTKYGALLPFPIQRNSVFDFVGNKYTATGEPVYSIETR